MGRQKLKFNFLDSWKLIKFSRSAFNCKKKKEEHGASKELQR